MPLYQLSVSLESVISWELTAQSLAYRKPHRQIEFYGSKILYLLYYRQEHEFFYSVISRLFSADYIFNSNIKFGITNEKM